MAAAVTLAGCGGGGGSGTTAAQTTTTPTPTPTPTPVPTPTPTPTNFAAVTVDGGPAALSSGSNSYIALNSPFVSVTICVPGTTRCQTVDHVLVDTGSVGLRVLSSVLDSSLLAALPAETDAAANPVGECYGFVDGYIFGSVRQADVQLGGEAVSSIPVHMIGEGGAYATVPSACSSGGGTSIVTAQDLGANGVLGIGVTTTDCGTVCESGGKGAAIYYDCPSTGCSTVIARTASAAAPYQQLPNPISAMAVDNNGSILSLPSVSANGQATATGTLFFGIGTQSNNALGTATVLTTTTSASTSGAGLLTALYNGRSLTQSIVDSGSNLYFFVDSAIPGCTGSFKGYYCPTAPITINAALQGQNGASALAAFTLYNARSQLASSNAAVPGVGANPNQLSSFDPYPNSFDFGLPFFYGRSVYTAIEGRNAGGVAGPYVAF